MLAECQRHVSAFVLTPTPAMPVFLRNHRYPLAAVPYTMPLAGEARTTLDSVLEVGDGLDGIEADTTTTEEELAPSVYARG